MDAIAIQDEKIIQRQEVIELVINGLNSIQTIRAYTRALGDFFDWYVEEARPLNKATVTKYRMHMIQSGMGSAAINQRLSAIRKMASEAFANDWLSTSAALGIADVPGVKQQGQRLGNWMTKDQVIRLLSLPGNDLTGLRDKAVLAILISSGLRRSECASLQVDQLQTRKERPVLVDIIGKGNKTRSIPCIDWAFDAVRKWLDAAKITDGYVFRGVFKGRRRIRKTRMTNQSVYDIIKKYSELLDDVSIATHDMRRTYARLAYDGGAPIKQIQLALGHKSMRQTEIYLGIDQDFDDSPAEYLGIAV